VKSSLASWGSPRVAEPEVTELSASPDGSVHVALDIPTGEADPDEDRPDEPGPDVIAGAAMVAKTVLGTIWDVIKPEE